PSESVWRRRWGPSPPSHAHSTSSRRIPSGGGATGTGRRSAIASSAGWPVLPEPERVLEQVGRQQEDHEKHPERDNQPDGEDLDAPRSREDHAGDDGDGERQDGEQDAAHLLREEPLELERVPRMPSHPKLVPLDAPPHISH